MEHPVVPHPWTSLQWYGRPRADGECGRTGRLAVDVGTHDPACQPGPTARGSHHGTAETRSMQRDWSACAGRRVVDDMAPAGRTTEEIDVKLSAPEAHERWVSSSMIRSMRCTCSGFARYEKRAMCSLGAWTLSAARPQRGQACRWRATMAAPCWLPSSPSR